MDSDSPFFVQPPLFTVDFAFNIIFTLVSLGQLVLVLLLMGIKMARKPWADTLGSVNEQELALLRLHRARFVLLMAFTLILLIIVYCLQTAYMFNGFIPRLTYLTISTAYNAFSDIRNTFFFAVLIAVLDSGIKLSQLRRKANGMQGGTNVNIIVMSCLVGVLAILTIARTALIGRLNARPVVTTAAEKFTNRWAQFGLAQVRIFISIVLSIYYTIVTISMWRKKNMVPHEADKSDDFRVLKRIAILVCPLLLLLTIYTILADPIANTIINGDNYWSFTFADDFISGVITVLLNLAIISVGHAL